MRVGAGAEQLGVARGEVGGAAAELGDLRRADEGEVHRPEEHHAPLAGVARVGDLGELVAGLEARHRLQAEGRKLISNGQHRGRLLLDKV